MYSHNAFAVSSPYIHACQNCGEKFPSTCSSRGMVLGAHWRFCKKKIVPKPPVQEDYDYLLNISRHSDDGSFGGSFGGLEPTESEAEDSGGASPKADDTSMQVRSKQMKKQRTVLNLLKKLRRRGPLERKNFWVAFVKP